MCLSVGLSVCKIQFSVVTWGCEGWCVCLLVWVCMYDSVLSGDVGLWGLMCLSVRLSVYVWFSSQWWRGVVRVDVSVCWFECVCMIQFSVVMWGCEGWCVCLLVWVCVYDSVLSGDVGLWGLMCLSVGLSVYVWFSSQWWRGVVRVDVSVCWFECVCMIQFSVVMWGCEGWCVCLLVWVCMYDSVLSGDVGLWGLMCLSVGLSVYVWFSSQWWCGVVRVDVSVCWFECVCMIQFSVVTWGCEGWCVYLLVWVCMYDSVLSGDVGLWGLMCLSVGLSVYVWFSSQWWCGVVRVDVSVCWFECVCMIQFSVVTWGCEGWCVCLLVWVCVYDSVLSGDVGLWGLMCLSVGLSVCMIQFSVVTWGCEGWCVCLLVGVRVCMIQFSVVTWGCEGWCVCLLVWVCVCMIQFSVVTWGCEGWCVCLLVWVCVWFSSQWWRGVVRVDVSVCWFECVCVWYSSQWWRGVVRVDVSVCWLECVYDTVLSGDMGLWGLMCLSVVLSVCVWFSSQWWRGVVRVDVSVCWLECVYDTVLSGDVGLWGLMCLSVVLSVCVWFSSQWWCGVVRVDVSVCCFECVCMIQFSVVTWGCEGWCVCLLVGVCVWYSSQWWRGVVRVDVSVCWFECVCMIQFSVVMWGCEGWCVCLLFWVCVYDSVLSSDVGLWGLMCLSVVLSVCVWYSSQWWRGVVRVDVSVCWLECVYDTVLSGDVGLWGLMCLSVVLSVCVWFSSQWWRGVVRVDVSVCCFECVCMIQFSVVTWGCEGWCVCLLVWVCVYYSVLSGDVGLWGLMCLSVGWSVCMIQFSVVTWGCEGWCVCLLFWVCVYDSVLSGDVGLWGLMCLSVGLSVCVYDTVLSGDVGLWGLMCLSVGLSVCVWFSSQWWRGVVRVDVSVCCSDHCGRSPSLGCAHCEYWLQLLQTVLLCLWNVLNYIHK